MNILRQFIREVLNPCGDSDLDKIFSTATMAHQGQMRRSGTPYIEHPIEVATLIKRYYPGSDILCKAALLHDALEDAPALGNVKDADELFAIIADASDSEEEAAKITQLVQALTKAEGADYSEYVMSLSADPDAIKIKMADMLHNLRSAPSEKQIKKYGNALAMMEDSFGGKPPGVSEEHWNDLKAAVGNNTSSPGIVEGFVKEMLAEDSARRPGAGIVVVRKCDAEYRVCCLKVPGEEEFDLPKGCIDPGEDTLQTALRETQEEAGISVLDFGWGDIPIQLAHLTMYVASTPQVGSIVENPETGILEHESIHWLPWDVAVAVVRPYLSPAIMWARNRVEGIAPI